MRFRSAHLLAMMSIAAVLPTAVLHAESLWARCALLILPAIVGGFLEGGTAPARLARPRLRIYRRPG